MGSSPSPGPRTLSEKTRNLLAAAVAVVLALIVFGFAAGQFHSTPQPAEPRPFTNSVKEHHKPFAGMATRLTESTVFQHTRLCSEYAGPGTAHVRLFTETKPTPRALCDEAALAFQDFLASNAARFGSSGSGDVTTATASWHCQIYGAYRAEQQGFAADCEKDTTTAYLTFLKEQSGRW